MVSIAPSKTSQVPDVGDRTWAERIRAGDRDAFELVFRRLASGLRAFAVRYVGSEEQAEDVVQDLFLSLWRGREALDIQVSLVTYLYTGARNRALNYLKHERVAREWRQTRERLPAPSAPAAEEGVLEAELAQRVQQAITRLPERTKLVFTMSRERKMKYDEIAQELGLSVKTVETQMGRALRLMRGHLREFLA